jgi:hypothetical protein
MRMYARTLCASFILACFGAFILPPAATAQVAGPNVNMVSGTKWPTGDPFLQRQNEPSMAVSTRNPMHILAGANDYRTVDLELALSGGVETGDAWLGLFKSFDGGLTWQSTLLPGCVQQSIPQCKDNGALGGIYQAASDPVVRAGTNGMFYYAGLAFDRATSPTTASSVSSIFVARYNDLNNNENLDPITYIDTHIVAMGESSKFLDKPSMAVDIPRAGASTCSFTANEPGAGANGGTLEVHQSFAAGNVYIAYTDFLTPTKANTTPTHLMFTHSTDCGVTWSAPVQINTGTTTSQGSAIAVNPLNGHVYVAWRQFSSTGVPDAIMMAQSGNAGRSFGAPVRISTFQPFDQGTTGTSFRTNAYPSITTDFFGFVYVAFSARGLTSSGDARVVAAGSIDGAHWTPAFMVDNPSQSAQGDPAGRGHQIMPAITFANGRLTLLYYDLRLDHYQGLYTPNSASLTGYDEMLQPEGELALTPAQTGLVFNNYIDDAGLTLRRHTLDLRVLELGIFPTITLGPSVLVSQYAYGCCVNPNMPDIEQFKFNVPNLPLFAQGSEPFLGDYIDVVPSPQFVPNGKSWAYNFAPSANPLFHATWTDNRDVVPPADGNWQNYTPAVPVGTPSVFQPGSTVPSCQTGQEGMRNQNIYTAQITGGLIVGAPGNAKPLGTTTFNWQTVPFQRAFAVEAQNVTSQQIFVRFSIANQPTGGSASFLQFSPLTTLDITIPSFSSVSRSVFVTSTNPHATVTVNVTQISAIGGSVVANGLSATAVLNPDITNPNITNPNITNPNITNPNITNFEVTNPNITNPNITNPNITNPNITNPNITNPNITNPNITNVSATNPNITNTTITNPDITNPNITNPNITNPDITNGSIQDVVYPITNDGNTTATYTVKTATFSAPPSGIVLQLIINKLYQTPVAVNCQMGTETHWNTVANITAPKLYTASDPQLGNPNITNAAPNEASVTLAPSETAYITVRVVNPTPLLTPFNPLAAIVPVTVPQAVNTQTVLSNPGTVVFPPVTVPPLVVTTATLPDGIVGHSFNANVAAQGGNPGADTWSVSSGTLPNTLVLNTATGAISGTLTAVGTFTFSIQVKDTAIGTQFPQHTVTQSFTVHVASPLALAPVSLPGGTQGTFYSQTILPTGGLSPVTVSLTSGAVPAGLVFKGGTITGTPTATGTSNFTVQATDSSNPQQVFTQSYSINIVSPIPTVGNVVFTTQPANSVGGQALAGSPVQVTVTDNTGAVIPGVPVAMSFNGTPPCAAATLGGTLNSTTNAAGVATFSNLSVDLGQIGYTLKATVLGASGVSNPFTVNGFCGTTSLSIGRELHTEILLGTGKVLIAGGLDLNGVALKTAELYDPSTGIVSPTGNLSAPNGRGSQASIALQNGQVLLIGGVDNTGANLATAELYDPASGTFSATGSMAQARGKITAVLLANGKVLVAGGSGPNGDLAGAEIYDPVSGLFTPTGSLSQARERHTMTLLANGKVLIAGGRVFTGNGFSALSSAELFDPQAGQGVGAFSAVGSMNSPRDFPTATLLPDGTVLLAGGFISNQTNLSASSAEIFNAATNSFALTGSLSTPRTHHTASLLPDGTVLVAGGVPNSINGTPSVTTAEIYSLATGTFSPTGSMTTQREYGQDAVLANGDPFISGGDDGVNVTSTAEIYYSTAPLAAMQVTTPTTLAAGQPNTTVFSNPTAFGGAATNITSTGFNGILPSGTQFQSFNPLVVSGISFSTSLPGTFVDLTRASFYSTIAPPYPADFIVNSSNGSAANQIVITLPNATRAVGLDFGALGFRNVPSSGNVTLSNGFVLPLSSLTKVGNTQFAGFVSATPITTLAYNVANDDWVVLDVLLGTANVALPNAVQGQPYTQILLEQGGVGPLTWTLASGALPPGINLSASGILLGTPTASGAYSFSVHLVDSSNPQKSVTSATLTLNVVTPPQPPTGLTAALIPGVAGVSLNWNASASTVAGYNVYRATRSGGPYTKINPAIVTGLSYTDTAVVSSTTYYYVVTAVDAIGTESVFSNEAHLSIP